MNWTLIYNGGLVSLIVAGLAMIGIMFYRKQFKWAIFFSSVFISVLLFEGLSYLENGKTISNQYGVWIQAEPVWAISALVLMVIWMASLVIHLLAAGLRKKK